MNTVGLIYLVLIGFLYLTCWRRDRRKTLRSLHAARSTLIKLLPMLVAIFGLIGLVQVFVPAAMIESLLGDSGGFLSILTAGSVGAIAIGPPLAAFPLAGSLLEAGAWPPAIATFVVSWILVGFLTLPLEIELFGLRFALARNGISFAAALLIGSLVGVVL